MNDIVTVAAAIGAAVGTVAVKMTVDKVRGGNGSALKEKVEAHIRDDDDKFDKLFGKIDGIHSRIDKVATDVAYIRGQLSREN